MRQARHRAAVGALLVLVASIAAGCAAPPPTAAPPPGHQRAPGSRVWLRVPEGFVAVAELPGFETDDQLTAIVVNELQASTRSTIQSLTTQGFAAQGMTLQGQQRLEIDGYPARLYDIREELRGIPFRRWTLVFGSSSTTVVISALTPVAFADEMDGPLRRALESVRWRRHETPPRNAPASP